MKANRTFHLYTVSLFVLSFTTFTWAASYEIEEIAVEVNPYGAISAGSINSAGEIVYRFKADGTNPDLFKFSNSAPSVLYASGLSTDPIRDIDGFNTPLNNIGFIAFVAQLTGAGGYGLYTGNGGSLTTIAETAYVDPESSFFYLDNTPDINDANMVAFGAMDKVNWTWGLYKGDGGAIVEIAIPDSTTTDLGQTFYAYGIHIQPVINNEGTTAFIAQTNPSSANSFGIFKYNGSTISTVYDTTGPFKQFYKPIDMNDSGTLAFIAQTDAGPYGIYTGNGGTVTTVVDDSGPMTGFTRVAINNNGQVVFLGKIDGDISKEGIFIGPDPVADKILYEGETYMGGTIVWLDLFRGINDAGQISFNMQLDYGDYITRGLYVATPAECGDENHPYPLGDFSLDCRVNLMDMAILSADWENMYDLSDLMTMAENWLTCNDPAGCP